MGAIMEQLHRRMDALSRVDRRLAERREYVEDLTALRSMLVEQGRMIRLMAVAIIAADRLHGIVAKLETEPHKTLAVDYAQARATVLGEDDGTHGLRKEL